MHGRLDVSMKAHRDIPPNHQRVQYLHIIEYTRCLWYMSHNTTYTTRTKHSKGSMHSLHAASATIRSPCTQSYAYTLCAPCVPYVRCALCTSFVPPRPLPPVPPRRAAALQRAGATHRYPSVRADAPACRARRGLVPSAVGGHARRKGWVGRRGLPGPHRAPSLLRGANAPRELPVWVLDPGSLSPEFWHHSLRLASETMIFAQRVLNTCKGLSFAGGNLLCTRRGCGKLVYSSFEGGSIQIRFRNYCTTMQSIPGAGALPTALFFKWFSTHCHFYYLLPPFVAHRNSQRSFVGFNDAIRGVR